MELGAAEEARAHGMWSFGVEGTYTTHGRRGLVGKRRREVFGWNGGGVGLGADK